MKGQLRCKVPPNLQTKSGYPKSRCNHYVSLGLSKRSHLALNLGTLAGRPPRPVNLRWFKRTRKPMIKLANGWRMPASGAALVLIYAQV